MNEISASSDGSLARALYSCWALLFGMGMVLLGLGLQNPLLGLRASMEGFSSLSTGLVMSGYFLGFTASSILTPRLVGRVGHIRVFAALASLVSISALLHLFAIDPLSWTIMRFLSGFCMAGLYITAESWLNEDINNRTRGRLLSIYMVVTLGGMGFGPLLLNLADPEGHELFVLVSIIFSFALIPILLSVNSGPDFKAPLKLKTGELFKNIPVGLASCFATGVSNSVIIGIGAVYARAVGLNVAQTSLFIGAVFWGGVILQWPVGYFSDKYDRRAVIAWVTFLAAISSVVLIFAREFSDWLFYIMTAVLGGLSFPMYSLGLAYANDQLEPSQMVQASGGLVMIYSLGAVLGPLLSGWIIDFSGPHGFFALLALTHSCLGIYTVYRIKRFEGVPLEDQGPHVYISRTSPVAAAAAFDVENQ